jgi:hypothetical protein
LEKGGDTAELVGDRSELRKVETLELAKKTLNLGLDSREIRSRALNLREQRGDLGLDGRDGDTSIVQDASKTSELGLNIGQGRLHVGEVTSAANGVAKKVLDQGDGALKLVLDRGKLRKVKTLDKSEKALDLGLDRAESRGSGGTNERKKALNLGLNVADSTGFLAGEVRDIKTLELAQDASKLGLDTRDIGGAGGAVHNGGSRSRSRSTSERALALGSLDTVLLASIKVIAEVSTSMVQTRVQSIQFGFRDTKLLGDRGARVSIGD